MASIMMYRRLTVITGQSCNATRFVGYKTPTLLRYQSTSAMVNERVTTVDTVSIDSDIHDIEELSPITLRGSPEAHFGRKRQGGATLPEELSKAIDQVLAGTDKKLIRFDTARIHDALRTTAAKSDTETPKKEASSANLLERIRIQYGERESNAYLASRMAATYGVTYNVLGELSTRIQSFKPKSILDFGTGPGTSLWAAANIWNEGDGVLERCMGVDVSEPMLRLAEQLLTVRPKALLNSDLVFRRYLSYNLNNPPYDLTVSAFTLGDISSDQLRQSTLEALWRQTSDVLVLIDRGTPEGFRIISEARDWLLNGPTSTETPCHIVAPCPHDGGCPMQNTKSWCHFSQRIQRPTFMIRAKQAKNNFEDTKYSYLIVRKGKRPASLIQPNLSATSTTTATEQNYEMDAYHWPRLINAPLKRVVMLLWMSVHLQRMTIPKSQGKLPYRDARKSLWGDLFPHPPKKPARIRLTESTLTETEALEDNKSKNTKIKTDHRTNLYLNLM
ncbi:mitochondrial small ribosomal subunit Rsm22-domain-containing protein [Syncephalis fuscata]|nr:mitochondrial small ribosomal subunit Rsm22-domain-containing protein [Syncephalis fuscata]